MFPTFSPLCGETVGPITQTFLFYIAMLAYMKYSYVPYYKFYFLITRNTLWVNSKLSGTLEQRTAFSNCVNVSKMA